ncbi:ATP phosphoribosyltransferase [Vagococcus elongatus]|uniref:ATP phosphoribosyltransferase n=1 Tax=Vagococcus elongatus TaxID=180344 RepID=A0A430ALQ0_9ENTE|nr:ATP phosphoribosyltransferase [Vagococcus elongatus]RSU09070.1 ATP phosphoribosyltransferase [Vagococcus elongatus]
MLMIALTKGRLEKASLPLFEKNGYGVEKLKNKGRELVFQDTKKDIAYFLAKAPDCITYVEHGVADVGIVGKDTLLEENCNCYELLDLGIGKCQFIVAGLSDCDLWNMTGHIKIGTKYPRVARQYFNQRGMDVEIIKIEGSVEVGPLLGLCDGIVDIMETGTTLKENGLVVFDTVSEISARLIVNKASFILKKEEILTLLDDIKSKEA